MDAPTLILSHIFLNIILVLSVKFLQRELRNMPVDSYFL